jgi:hypothetical protein
MVIQYPRTSGRTSGSFTIPPRLTISKDLPEAPCGLTRSMR